jgi:hypothetical protein
MPKPCTTLDLVVFCYIYVPLTTLRLRCFREQVCPCCPPAPPISMLTDQIFIMARSCDDLSNDKKQECENNITIRGRWGWAMTSHGEGCHFGGARFRPLPVKIFGRDTIQIGKRRVHRYRLCVFMCGCWCCLLVLAVRLDSGSRMLAVYLELCGCTASRVSSLSVLTYVSGRCVCIMPARAMKITSKTKVMRTDAKTKASPAPWKKLSTEEMRLAKRVLCVQNREGRGMDSLVSD